MGNRLHVAKEYKVEYGTTASFNWGVGAVHSLLSALGVYYTGEEFDEVFDVYKDDLRHGIDKLKSFDSLDEDERWEIEEPLKDLGKSPMEAYELFTQYLKECDPDIDYLHFCFF